MVFRSFRLDLISIALIVSFCFFADSNLIAQDGPGLESLKTKWADLNKLLDEKQKALEDGDTTPGLSQEFGNLVEEANDMVNQLRAAGVADLNENPDATDTIRLLMGIMLNDAEKDKEAEVLSAGEALIKAKASEKYFEYGATAERLKPSQQRIFEELSIRQREANADDLPRIEFKTTQGTMIFELYENEAPNTVKNFVSLTESGYYDNKIFHRVIDRFMAQTGGFEKVGVGSGGPGYKIPCECVTPEARPHFTGSLSMAHIGSPDTGGSQFYIVFERERTEHLDKKHTVFGRVIEGLDVLEKIERTAMEINGMPQPIPNVDHTKIVTAKVLRKREHDYKPRKVGDPEPEPTPPETPELGKGDDSESEEKTEVEEKTEGEDKAEMNKEETSEEKTEGKKEEAAKEESGEKADEKETEVKEEAAEPEAEKSEPAKESGEPESAEKTKEGGEGGQ